VVGWRNLNHSQAGASLHQVKEIYIAGPECHDSPNAVYKEAIL
jgi:hypothetical protein